MNGYVNFSLVEPVQIDFDEVADVLDATGYNLYDLVLKVDGTIENDAFVVTETGQRLDLKPGATLEDGRIEGMGVLAGDHVARVFYVPR